MSFARKLFSVLSKLVLALLSAGMLAAASYASVYLLTHEAKAPRKPPMRVAPSVLVEGIQASNEQVLIRSMGSVIPAVTVDLQAQVSGRIIGKHPEFIEGGVVAEGDVLISIDPRDYELALVTRESQLEAARSEYKIEQGQQAVASREWEILDAGESDNPLDHELALRQPQLRRRQADLDSAEALVNQARLDLERTKVTAPFNAVVLTANVDAGDQATPQRQLCRLVGTDVFWVRVSVPINQLHWIKFPDSQGEGASEAKVISASGAEWRGRVLKLLSDLESAGLLAQLLVEVEDPLNLKGGDPDAVPLLLGERPRVIIEGRTVENVYKLPRSVLRDEGHVWCVTEDSRLTAITPEVVWLDEMDFLARGFDPDTRIVVSNLSGPVEDMEVSLPGAADKAKPAGPGSMQPPRNNEGTPVAQADETAPTPRARETVE